MDIVVETLDKLRSGFTRDPACIVSTGHGSPATALADATEYLCHCVFNCADRGTMLSVELHTLWGSSISHLYAARVSGSDYVSSALFTEYMIKQLIASVRRSPADIDRSEAPVLLEEAVRAFLQVHTHACESRRLLNEVVDRIKLCV